MTHVSYLLPGEATFAPAAGKPTVLMQAAPGNLFLAQQIPNTRYGTTAAKVTDKPLHDHLIDQYEPNGDIAIVALGFHGGGGNPRQYAASLGLLLGKAAPENVSWNTLKRLKMAVWMVEGQSCGDPRQLHDADGNVIPTEFNPDAVTTPLSTSWDNRSMRSGVDDRQMFLDLCASARARYGAGALYVAFGHSNGGMFVRRMWAENSTLGTVNCFMSSSGPLPEWWADTPPTPTIVKPLSMQYGLLDTVLQIYPGHLKDLRWIQSPSKESRADYQHPSRWLGDVALGLQITVDAYNSYKGLSPQVVNYDADAVTTTVHTGTKKTLTYCGGAVLMRVYDSADHSIKQHQICEGHKYLTDVATFTLSNLLA